MPNYGGFQQNAQQQAQYLNASGARMVEKKTGKRLTPVAARTVKGTKKQLIGTIVGIAAVIVLLLILGR